MVGAFIPLFAWDESGPIWYTPPGKSRLMAFGNGVWAALPKIFELSTIELPVPLMIFTPYPALFRIVLPVIVVLLAPSMKMPSENALLMLLPEIITFVVAPAVVLAWIVEPGARLPGTTRLDAQMLLSSMTP